VPYRIYHDMNQDTFEMKRKGFVYSYCVVWVDVGRIDYEKMCGK